MNEISLQLRARIDYLEAVDWYRSRSLVASARFERAVESALRIAEAPDSWALWDDRHRIYTLRKFPFNIVYRIEVDQRIMVIAIVHSRRAASSWQDRL